MMDGRFFDNRQVIAYIATGDEKFSKSNTKKFDMDDDDLDGQDDEGKRLDKFGNWLEESEREAEVES